MKIYVNNINLYYKVIGTGEPLIFVHGNGENHHIYDQLAEKLKQRYTCYLIDSRAHGLSDTSDHLSYNVMTKDIFEFCKVLQLNNIHLIGFSDGGIVGLKLAIKHPKLIKNLYVLGANYHIKGIKQDVYKSMKKLYKKEKSPLIKLMIKEPKLSIKSLKSIEANTHIFAGSLDVIKEKHTLKLHQVIKHSTCHILNGETHESYVINSTKLLPYIK